MHQNKDFAAFDLIANPLSAYRVIRENLKFARFISASQRLFLGFPVCLHALLSAHPILFSLFIQYK